MDANRKTAAAIVSTGVDGEPSYAMYEAQQLTGEGAFLTGPLLLEHHEQFTLELALPGGETVRTRARVARVEYGPVVGMAVRFIDLPDEVKRKLTNGRND